VLNAQRKPEEYLQDRARLSADVEDCFFALTGLAHDQRRLRGQLEEAHWASGLKPREGPGLHNGLVDPAEMMVRAFHFWGRTRWPGRNGRVHYAHTLFNLYVIRCLELLTMRIWDDGPAHAGERLAQVQDLLDRLWAMAPADQPVFVRDARWLVLLAQSPVTDDLGAYFGIAERVAETLSVADRLEICRADVRMVGGHLRSQARHLSTKRGVDFDDSALVLSTRSTNALDFALLIQALVPLLGAYEEARDGGDDGRRLELAGAICQGVSPDPELFLGRLDLLAAYSLIEHLFVATDDRGNAVYTPVGQRHVRLVHAYKALVGRVAASLARDCPRFRPVAGTCSPYGVLYGFSSDLIGHMALKALQPDAVAPFSLEDVFVDGDASVEKLAWVSGWRKLPHIPPDVQALFEYPQAFAEEMFDRLERTLRGLATNAAAHAPSRTGHLLLAPEGDRDAHATAPPTPDLPVGYIESSDTGLVAAKRAVYREEAALMSDRREGRCLLSYRTAGGWVAIPKTVLTDVLGAGHDAKIVGLPPPAAAALTLMCPGLVVGSTG